MTEAGKEIVKIFTELSPESQNTFLMYARIAHVAESALRKSINRALSGEDVTSAEHEKECKSCL